ncbi:hypothetical protein Nepgr_001394 [Nepenthes gracilis]|uniref:RecA family profile 1 domain-containing protein n=1 Tax=Nepenthes gracilis TaxID=150966 RepID=A0AAD3RXQ1_NEPGR|nr:hypothetical protein Nepgr_001394 [Nepenthes gracilis]
MAVREWIKTDETAEDLLSRVLRERPPLLLPPLHRLPLRAGNVVEVVGPSPCAKTQILIQVAVNSILPKEWKGVYYGGLEHSVMFIDLDCRFDILRLLQLLKHRIANAYGSTCLGSSKEVKQDQRDGKVWRFGAKEESDTGYEEDLIEICLRRFLYIRCYDSYEFLATLKTLHDKLQWSREELGTSVHFLMIDSIGAYYWVDRASTSLPLGAKDRKTLSLQSVTEAVVNEIRNILLVHPMLVLATKATIFGDKCATNDIKRKFSKWSSQDTLDQSMVGSGSENLSHREYMPSVWQSFVTYRIFVRPSFKQLSAANYDVTCEQVYLAEWLLPSLGITDKFAVTDAGIFMVT